METQKGTIGIFCPLWSLVLTYNQPTLPFLRSAGDTQQAESLKHTKTHRWCPSLAGASPWPGLALPGTQGRPLAPGHACACLLPFLDTRQVPGNLLCQQSPTDRDAFFHSTFRRKRASTRA